MARRLFVLGPVAVVLSVVAQCQGALIFVKNNPNSVGIVDQHPLARAEALYDTKPLATGRYNRQVDVDTVSPKRFYSDLPDYYRDATPGQLRTSMINGGWYCSPTAALSLIHFWDADPRFPNLFNPATDTDRSVILAMAELMDTDDLTLRGGNDPNENHSGTEFADILPALLKYFNDRYPGKFSGGERSVPVNADTDDYNGPFGAAYDTAIRRNIPVLLEFKSHTTVGIGFNDEFARETLSHYRVNDPWDARKNISGIDVGRGRPLGARGVFGITWAEELYGDGADVYDETPQGPSPDGLPVAFHYIFAFEDGDPLVPEPGTMCLALAGMAAISAFSSRRRFAARRRVGFSPPEILSRAG